MGWFSLNCLLPGALRIARRLLPIDYTVGSARVSRLDFFEELAPPRQAPRVAFLCNCRKNYHLDSRLPKTVQCIRSNRIAWEVLSRYSPPGRFASLLNVQGVLHD